MARARRRRRCASSSRRPAATASSAATDDRAAGRGGMAGAALILGCSGTALTAEEQAFFRDVDPLGFILFRRNIGTPDEVRALTSALRETVGRDAPVLVD